MNCKIGKLTAWFAAAVLVFGIASTASAQVFTGRVDVTVEDTTGGRLPGVNVDLTGPATQTQVTDAEGQAHFLNLPVGTYTVKAALSGFNTFTNTQVVVGTGSATPLMVRMAVAGTAETVNVTAATPIIDLKRETTTTNVTLEELQNIPTARDPWVIMQTVPTIFVDRVNVGGSESGQQSNYLGKVNLVLKKGSNTPHGNARYYFENEGLQANNMDPTLARTIGGTNPECISSNFTKHCGNRTDSYKDYGFDLGGPILKDKLWAWGTIGKTNPRILTLLGTPDETILKNYAFKADGQATTNLRGNFTFFEGNKEKFGRGASPTHPSETTWNQSGPTKYYKGEGNFVVGQNLFVAGRYAYISGGFSLTPVGGLDKDFYKDDAGVWHNSYYFYSTKRPQHFAGADASYFTGKHELKFGFSWRKTPVDSISQVTGHKIITIWNGYPDMLAYAQQDWAQTTDARYVQGFITDTLSMNRLTVIGGIRFDRQTSSYLQTSVAAVPSFPLLPAVTAAAVPNAYTFNNVTPRVGITYALDDSRKTIARASYAMFASQLPGSAAGFVSPIQPYTYVYYNAVDKNGNGVADLNEIDFAAGVQGSNEVDLAHPGVRATNNKVADISVPRTNEAMFGVDRELMPNFGVSATLTYRYMNNFLWAPRNGVTPASYVQTGTFAGTFPEVGSVSVPFYGATSALPGYTQQNRPDYHQRYLGFELSATKRMANHWMGRFGFASTSWNEYFDGPNAILDKTPTRYQGPWGIDLGANLVFRQGYGEPFFRSRINARDPVIANKNLLLAKGPDQFRLDAVTSLDARVEKMFKFGTTSVAFDFDVFNLFNNATVLGKQYDARLTSYDTIQEIMNPRIARLGVRFFF
ncbi:MAG: hypothetical protein DMG04_12285 [Acidobacteria bacterium]|nr:MAG: hypothetical protein DMG04_12285 [Acidobacteriota bacterium]